MAAVVVAATVLVWETRRDVADRARDRVTAVATTLASSPYVRAQLGREDPSHTLQPYAERVRRETGTDFVVVMAPDRTRYSHPNPAQVGRPFIGTIEPALDGRTFVETSTGTLGPSVRVVAPVFGADGAVDGLVAVGLTTERIGAQLADQLPVLLLLCLLGLAAAATGAVLVSRRLRRQTHGLGASEITRMYEYYDAVLHAVREGILLLDRDRRLQLANDEARRLLGLGELAPGTPVEALGLPASIVEALLAGREAADELHLARDRVLVVNQSRAVWRGRDLGTVTTLRDRTDLEALTGELDATRAFAESLRSQAHEAANRLHTVVSLIELGRPEDAVRFATEELELAQALTDRVVAAVREPVISALLLGKAAQAAERGVELEVTDDSELDTVTLPAADLVTLVGNLVDNAIDAAAAAAPPRTVAVTLLADGGELVVRVADTGSGLEPEQVEEALRRGWSTKDDPSGRGRGLGLALVRQVVGRYGGSIDVGRDRGAVFTVRLPLPEPAPVEEPR